MAPASDVPIELFRTLLALGVRRILEDEDYPTFVEGFAEDLESMVYASPDEELPPVDARPMAHALGRLIWNVTPLPSNDWKPRPIPAPGRNDPCPCGSGRKFKQCCAQIPAFPVPTLQQMWPAVLTECSPAQVGELLAKGRVSFEMLHEAAFSMMEDDRADDALELIEPLFAGDVTTLPAELAPVVSALILAHSQLGNEAEAASWFERLCTNAPPAVRSEAMVVRAGFRTRGDDADSEAAAAAAIADIAEAQRLQPESASAAQAELLLLLQLDRVDESKARARTLQRQFAKVRGAPAGFVDYLEDMARDPRVTTLEGEIADPDFPVARLLAWVDRLADSPLPAGYRVVEGNEVDLEDVFDDEPREGHPITLEGPDLSGTHKRWSGLCTIEDEREPGYESVDIGDALEHPDPWTGFLARDPRTADSLCILDDVCAIVSALPGRQPWIDRYLLLPVLERGWRIATEAMASAKEGDCLRWSYRLNRAMLRMGDELIRQRLVANREADAAAIAQLMLSWDPLDECMVRDIVIGDLLASRDWDKAIDLASRFPDDDTPHMAFGHALALFGKGAKAEAEQALAQAVRDNEYVVPALLRDRAADASDEPEFEDEDDEELFAEAEDYRDMARERWVAVEGALEWLAGSHRATRRRSHPAARGSQRR